MTQNSAQNPEGQTACQPGGQQPSAEGEHAAAQAAVPRVVALMGEVHGWSQERRDTETRESIQRLQTSL